MSYVRLVLLAAIAIGFLSIGATALWYRGQAISAVADRDRAVADLGTAVSANKVQEETIGRLRSSAAANDKIVAELADQLSAINEAISETNQAVGDLKDANEDVRAYLNTLVPADLRMLLDR